MRANSRFQASAGCSRSSVIHIQFFLRGGVAAIGGGAIADGLSAPAPVCEQPIPRSPKAELFSRSRRFIVGARRPARSLYPFAPYGGRGSRARRRFRARLRASGAP